MEKRQDWKDILKADPTGWLMEDEWGKLTEPPEPRLATYHIIAALHEFGLLGRLLS